ncbi:MAG TPA: hemolysin III family protein [Clostridia bacterium]|nr:hemolysin III family protein [Clostridia bacterium]
MSRIKLKDRKLPNYTRGEEIANMISHIVGGGIGIAALAVCVVLSALNGSKTGIVSSIVFGVSMVLLYTMSSIYHGLKPPMAKKVFQVLDHCTIYLLIAGTYTPIALCAIRKVNNTKGWVVFGIVWAIAALAITLTAIDLKKFKVFSMVCYLGMGWSVVFSIRPLIEAVTWNGFALLLAGGLFYTIGTIFYGLGKKKRYSHFVFHLFVILGSLSHFLCIALYVI